MLSNGVADALTFLGLRIWASSNNYILILDILSNDHLTALTRQNIILVVHLLV